MGKFNYLVMLLRVRTVFFMRDRVLGRKYFYRNQFHPSSTLMDELENQHFDKFNKSKSEYRIHISKEQITHCLN